MRRTYQRLGSWKATQNTTTHPPYAKVGKDLARLDTMSLRPANDSAYDNTTSEGTSTGYQTLVESDDCSILTTENEETLVICDPQEQSLLFQKLPREIRNDIWAYATAPLGQGRWGPFQNGKSWDGNPWLWGHPRGTDLYKSCTKLLYTCRRIWLEANALPMLQTKHCFWNYDGKPYGYLSAQWMANLTPMNRQNLGELHLFIRQAAIQPLTTDKGMVRYYFLDTEEVAGDFQPRVLDITVHGLQPFNYTDRVPDTLDYDNDDWVQALLDSPDLRSTHILKVSFKETDDDVHRLKPHIEHLAKLRSRQYATHIIDGKEEETKFVLTSGLKIRKTGDYYYEFEEGTNYSSLTLTWTLRFPNIEKANVAKLRQAPRIDAPETRRENQVRFQREVLAEELPFSGLELSDD